MSEGGDPRDAGRSLRLPPNAFTKLDPAPDAAFYAKPRLVHHIDEGAIAAVTSVYREFLPPDGDILDLMSSWVSHLPADVAYRSVTGLGMNLQELRANPRLTDRLVQDLNADPLLPWQSRAFDAAAICVSIQYLQAPVEVFSEVARVLRPGAPFVVSMSNRCFPTKAVAIWRSLRDPEHPHLIAAYMRAAGFQALAVKSFVPRQGDPLRAVIGHTPENPQE